VPVVEPVFAREGLRNYKEEMPAATQAKDQEELRQLLDSLKSSDVISVQHKKASLSSRTSQEKEGRPKPLLLNMEDQGLTGERRYTKSPPKTRSSIFSSKPYNASHYVPSFSSKPQATSLPSQEPILGGPVVAKKLQHEDTRSTAKVSFGGREGVGDFTSRVVESFSDLSLGPLGLSDSRAMHKVQSMPELKSVSLTVGRKALHSKPGGFNSPSNRSFNSPGNRGFNSPTLGGGNNKVAGSGYVPSQMEAKPKPSFQVRTDWKAKYLK